MDKSQQEQDAATIERLTGELLADDQRLTGIRVALTAAGVPEVEAYPDEPGISEYDRSLRAGGRVIPADERVRRLAGERDRALAQVAALRVALEGVADRVDSCIGKKTEWLQVALDACAIAEKALANPNPAATRHQAEAALGRAYAAFVGAGGQISIVASREASAVALIKALKAIDGGEVTDADR